MFQFDIPQETKLKTRVVAMAGSSFFNDVRKVLGTLAITIPFLALSGCGEGDGPTSIPNTAIPPLDLPPGFCDPINFEIECEPPGIVWFGGGQTVVVDNPDKSGINQSDKVARMQKFFDQPFGGTRLNPVEVPVDFSAGEAFKIKVWSERPVPVLFKLEETNDGTLGVDRTVNHAGGSAWEELCFDFAGVTPANTIGLTIIFDNGVQGGAIGGVFSGDWTFYYDDITQVESCVDTGPPTGIVPDVKLYDPTANPPIPADVEVTAFGSQSVIDPEYADDDTYGRVLAVSSGVGYGANIAQIGFLGGDPGFVTFYESLDFKVKGMPNLVIFVSLYEGGERVRINLSSSGLAANLGNGWYQVSIPISSFTGRTTATGIVFESDNTAPMQFTMLLNDIGFTEPEDTGGNGGNGGTGGDGHGAGSAGVFTETATESTITVTSITNSIDFSGNNTVANDASTAIPAFEGSVVLSIDYQDSGQTYGGAVLNFGGVDLTAYDTLNFTVDTSGITGFADLTIQLEPPGAGADGTNVQLSAYAPVATSGNWATYAIPLADFTATNFTAVDNLGFWNPRSGVGKAAPLAFGTLYVDDVYLSVAGGGGGGGGGGIAGNIVPDGGFEAAGTGGLQEPWFVFENGGTVSVSSANNNGGTYAARLQADASSGTASFPILKVERLGAGSLSGGESVTVSFDVIDVDTAGSGKTFVAELFTERTDPPGGATNEVILGGYDLTGSWATRSFTTNLGADAAGGVSLLFKADCGGNTACTMDVFIDNVSIVIN